MSLLSKLTLGAVAVLGVYALKPRRTGPAARAGSVSSPRAAHKTAAGATTRKRSAKPTENGAGSPEARPEARAKAQPEARPEARAKAQPKARTRNRPARRTKAKRAR